MELREAIESRRAIRAFAPQAISDEDVQDMAYLASRAASCANNQPWRFIFVRESTQIEELHKALSGGNYWAKNAFMIVAVFSRRDLDCVVGGRDYYLLGTGMALAHLMLAAVEKGYAAHPMAGFDEELSRKILKIPEDMQIITLVAIGTQNPDLSALSEKHQKSEVTRSERKQFSEFAWLDTYR